MAKVRRVKTRQKTVKKKRSTGSALSRIEPLNFSSGDGIKVNIYGRSGTGKTTFWATFPKPILALICSGGQKPGELRSINTAAYRKTIKQLVLESSDELLEVAEDQARRGVYKTIVLDHATGYQDLILREVLDLDNIPQQKSWGIATQQEYGQVAAQFKDKVIRLLNLDCNVVTVAQERVFEPSEDTGSDIMPYVASALSPSIVGWLNPAVDYIAETFIEKKYREKEIKTGKGTTMKRVPTKGVNYCLRVGPHDVFTTKFRVPKGVELPESIVDPTYASIMKYINGG